MYIVKLYVENFIESFEADIKTYSGTRVSWLWNFNLFSYKINDIFALITVLNYKHHGFTKDRTQKVYIYYFILVSKCRGFRMKIEHKSEWVWNNRILYYIVIMYWQGRKLSTCIQKKHTQQTETKHTAPLIPNYYIIDIMEPLYYNHSRTAAYLKNIFFIK